MQLSINCLLYVFLSWECHESLQEQPELTASFEQFTATRCKVVLEDELHSLPQEQTPTLTGSRSLDT